MDEGRLLGGEVDGGVRDGLRLAQRAGGVPFIITSPGFGAPGTGSRMKPGEIALTRTPRAPNSAAQARVRVSIAPLVEL